MAQSTIIAGNPIKPQEKAALTEKSPPKLYDTSSSTQCSSTLSV